MDTLQQITAKDIAGWDSLSDVASTFEKRGLKVRENLGEDNELVLQLTDREFIVLIEAGAGESASDFKPDDRRRRTNLVATNDYEEFTFLTRIRALDGQQHGRIKHQKLSFTKEQMTSEGGEKNTILQKLNSLEYGSAAAIYDDLYDTKQVVKEFYQQFETLRTDLVQEVAGIPDDRGDAKQRYVQVTLDRMIFLYFIQEKRLLDRDPNYLHDHHKQHVNEGENVYEEFYEPLFFDFLAENKKSTEFGALPYLNGGLFSKNPIEEEFEDARLGDTTARTNELFGDILDFLSDWNWNVDERLDIVDPKNLSPAILGHIFEQTVNQKEMGAYYTPEEITGFMSRRTIHPYLLDQLNEEVGANYEEIDDVFGFPAPDAESGVEVLADGGAVTAQVPTKNVETQHVETLYHDFLKETRVLDPAVGSGAFLLAAQEVLLDIYMQCIEFFQQMDGKGKTWELEERTVEELETIKEGRGSASLYAKRSIILNNLYGVDIDDGAVEICKLRLWLSMVADIEDEPSEVEPLPNIDFNIRQGNSLVGFTDLVELTDDGDASLNNWGAGVGSGVRELYEDVIEAIERHREATSATEAANARRMAESKIDTHSEELNKKVIEQFRAAGIESVDQESVKDFHPFHWVLEFAPVYETGGFDVVIGNPPWDRIKPLRDDFFSKYDETFRSRLPDDKDEVQEELLADEEIAQGWQEYQEEMEIRAEYFKNTPEYELQRPEIDGRINPSTNDLSSLFFERVFSLAGDSSRVAQILPGAIYNGASCKDLRSHLLDNTQLDVLTIFENHGIFEQVHNQYKFGVVIFKNGGSTDHVSGRYMVGDLSIFEDFDEKAIRIPRDVLEKYSPEAGIFPYIESEQKLEVLKTIIKKPPIAPSDAPAGYMEPYQGLRRTSDSDRFVDRSEAEYPVYGGKNVYQYSYTPDFINDVHEPEFWSVEEETDPARSAKQRMREKTVRDLKSAIYEAFDGTGSQKGFVDDLLKEHRGKPLSENDVLLDCTEFRIGLRRITNSTNERTLIASVLPKGIICHNTLLTIPSYQITPYEEGLSEEPLHNFYERMFTDHELFAKLGLLNSIPLDYLLRTKVDTGIVMYKFKESQMPNLSEGDNWFHYIAERAAQLNCYGNEFAEMRERLGGVESATDPQKRNEIQAEIDAAAFHAYGLDRRETQFILDDFHRVSNPRIMTEEYFDMVFEKFDQLEAEGPFK
ncbi:Eco57I restriction-modification methylase domain-containing protein [Natronosalvus caseinilyticus]|uniref:Eco57I restriction-modification methylase domain-containing protein n=1 Tax=Natronosalvus caseinilyticus TaxID=2953747 RepID=UPI0028AAA217|nr:DNA methyltransferase [Natronosalvus caseinilyticus]